MFINVDTRHAKATAAYAYLRSHAQSVTLATVDSRGLPSASYAPCVYEKASGDFYVLVSALAPHTANLKRCPRTSILLLEDSKPTNQPFARERISYECEASTIERRSTEWDCALARFSNRFGEIVKVLEQLPDFCLFRLHPRNGRFVRGFGQSYLLEGKKLECLTPIRPTPQAR